MTSGPGTFPIVEGQTLLGARLRLPAELPAVRTLVVVAFRRQQQALVDRWIARAVAAGVPATPRGATKDMEVAVVELPVLSTLWRPFRGFIDGGMTSAIADPDVLARTITVYSDPGAFQRALELPGGSEVQALVVGRSGQVWARGAGEPDEPQWSLIAAALFTD